MDPDDAEFYRWYGPWSPLAPREVAERFAGITVPWWVVGGWAIEAFTGRSRVHEDIDVAFFRADLPAVLAHLAPELCVWSNLDGSLRPLRRPGDLPEGCRQLWVRKDGASPWLMDLVMTPHDGDTWISVRDERVRMPLADALFEVDGIRYLRPEIALSLKARVALAQGVERDAERTPIGLRRHRPKDDNDLETTLELLDPTALAALEAAVELYHPDHPWLDRIRSGKSG